MKRVFVSSTSKDLKEHREAVRDAIIKMKMFPVMMEDFSAEPTPPVDLCMREVDHSDIYIGIFAHRYGYRPEGSEISITEMEYDRAVENDIPRLCFLVDPTYSWNPEHFETGGAQSRLEAFKTRINTSVVRSEFTTPESLAMSVIVSLQQYSKDDIPHENTGSQLKRLSTQQWETYRQQYLDTIINNTELQETIEQYEPVHVVKEDMAVFGSDNVDLLVPLNEGAATTSNQLPIDEATQHVDRAILLSSPGMGKTMTMKYLLLQQAIHARVDSIAKIPIYAHLSTFDPADDMAGHAFVEFLMDQVNTRNPSFDTQAFIKHALESGQLIVLLDALNEVAQDYQNAIRVLRKAFQRYAECRFVISTRTLEYRNELGIETRFYIQNYSPSALRSIVSHHLDSDSTRVEKFYKSLQANDFLRWINTPYLITLATRVYDRLDELPTKQTDLLNFFVRKMIEDESSRRSEALDLQKVISILAIVAYNMNKLTQTWFSKTQLAIWLEDLKAQYPLATDPDELIHICISMGLLNSKFSHEQYEFSHQIMQDFFSAQYLFQRYIIQGESAINDFLILPYWDETIIMMSQLMETPQELQKLLAEIEDDVFHHNLLLASRVAAANNVSLPRDIRKSVKNLFESSDLEFMTQIAAEIYSIVGNSNTIRELVKIALDNSLDRARRLLAVETIAKIGSENALITLLSFETKLADNHYLFSRMISAIGMYIDERVRALFVRCIESEDLHRQIRTRAMYAIAQHFPEDAESILLPIILDASQPQIFRETGVGALRLTDQISDVTRAILQRILTNTRENRSLRQRVGSLLGDFRDNKDNDLMIQFIEDRDLEWQLRQSIVLALGSNPNQQNLRILKTIVMDQTERKQIRWNACYAIGKILSSLEDDDAVSLLINVLLNKEEDNKVRWTAAYALSSINLAKEDEARNALVNIMYDHEVSDGIRERAAEALGRSGRLNNLDILSKLEDVVMDEDDFKPTVRARILRDIGRMNSYNMRDIVLDILENDEAKELRLRAVEWLGIVGKKEDVEFLVELFKAVADDNIKNAICIALDQIIRRYRLPINLINIDN